MFDPATFASTQITEAFEEDYTPLEDGEYSATIDSCEADVVGESQRAVLKVKFKISKPGSDADGVTVNDTIWLDVNDQGALESGKNKNIQLGRFLAAVNLNGKPWGVEKLMGLSCIIRTQQEEDRRDPTKVWPRVKGYARG